MKRKAEKVLVLEDFDYDLERLGKEAAEAVKNHRRGVFALLLSLIVGVLEFFDLH